MDTKRLIQFIEQERIAQGIAKGTLCGKADITTQYYKLVTDKGSIPSLPVLLLLLNALGYDLSVTINLPAQDGG